MNSFFVPTDLCQYVLKNKLTKPLQLYLLLKFECSGIIKINEQDKQRMAQFLNVKTIKTIDNNLKKLIELNWIGFNENTGWYFIRSFDNIKSQLKLKRRIYVELLRKDIVSLKGFLVGAFIGTLIREQRRRFFESERKKGRSIQFLIDFFPVANYILMKFLNISNSTASAYKECAVKHGYILRKKSYSRTNLSAKQLNEFKRQYEYPEKVKVVKDKIVIMKPDLICSILRIVARKKSNYNNKGLLRGCIS